MNIPSIKNDNEFSHFFLKAEKLREAGKLTDALEYYYVLILYMLEAEESIFSHYFTIIIERYSDLKQLKGDFNIPLELLSYLIVTFKERNQIFLFLHTIFKKALLLLESDQLENAFELLEEFLQPYIGSLVVVPFESSETLLIWESKYPLSDLSPEERSNFFSIFYYTTGKILSYYGQYSNATIALKRSILHEKELGKHYFLPLIEIEIARVLMEKGDLMQAEIILKAIQLKDQTSITSGSAIHFLELKAKFYILQGKLGSALNILQKIISKGIEHDLVKTVVISKINLAGFQIVLNQLSEAKENLIEAQELSKTNSYSELQKRIQHLLHLRHLRAVSPLSPINLSPSARNIPSFSSTTSKLTDIHEIPSDMNFLNSFECKTMLGHLSCCFGI